ncbi:hypothetical protein [Romboutsia sp. 1001713B170207_170306_H8]|uniref:hypothetical protein n=1 Tax=Romboutsia sp. 1001713B170207_170306_H8 TaxID=2787112 RepID=UPI0008210D63|nr:hypothetical protein [Romboutsia sp. 1001713B170207_170306_H8]SCH01369.1 Uncharacterised protein [uncultured Clostridium sp.]
MQEDILRYLGLLDGISDSFDNAKKLKLYIDKINLDNNILKRKVAYYEENGVQSKFV